MFDDPVAGDLVGVEDVVVEGDAGQWPVPCGTCGPGSGGGWTPRGWRGQATRTDCWLGSSEGRGCWRSRMLWGEMLNEYQSQVSRGVATLEARLGGGWPSLLIGAGIPMLLDTGGAWFSTVGRAREPRSARFEGRQNGIRL